MNEKRQSFEIKLNAIQDSDNPTRKDVEFILHDFDLNHNNSFISKETALKTLHTLKDMPIVCKYYPVTEAGADNDALGSHEVSIGEDRENGNPILEFNTVPIGVFTEDAYVTTVMDNGVEKEVVAGKGILWASRFPNVIGLLKEWYDNGVQIVSSMEILYDSYIFQEGKEEILSYVYEGHCVLNSETRGNHAKVYPAYDASKLTRLVAQSVSVATNKEGEKMDKFQKVFELSHSDIRTRLYQVLDASLEKGTYSWIIDTYDEYFIVNLYNFDQNLDKNYKLNYTKTEDAVEIDFESKVEVVEERKWKEIAEVKQAQAELQAKIEELEQLKTQLNGLESELETVKGEKDSIQSQFNSTSEQVIELTSRITELEPFKEKFEKAEFEKSLEEKQEFYSAKFTALNAIDKFESEEVQELIKKAVNENEEGKNAVFELNSMLLEMIQVKEDKQNEQPAIRELASKRENLLPEDDSFESRYSL